MATLTAHCIVKNEENFVGHAIRSVIDHVDKIIVFDTGSIDRTVVIVKNLAVEYPDKIYFEEKGNCDKIRHTQLRQEMIDRTETDWFMILDGDEVWTSRGMDEALGLINESRSDIDCLIAPFYLCVGDIFHQTRRSGKFDILGRMGYHSPRFLRCQDIKWQGDYNEDTLLNVRTGQVFFNEANTRFLAEKYWHLTHLKRSSLDDNDYSSGSSRTVKRRMTYFLIGKKINEPLPDVFADNKMLKLSVSRSFVNFILLVIGKFTNSIGV